MDTFIQQTLNGLVLGSIAMTTAPAATLMVIREYEAEGPVTATIMTLIGLNGLAATILFTLVGHLLFHGQNLATILLQVSAPLAIGGGIGLLVAFLAVPVVKLKDVPMLVVILIGIAAAVYSFVDVVRGKEEA